MHRRRQRVDDIEVVAVGLDDTGGFGTQPDPNIFDQFALANEFGPLCAADPARQSDCSATGVFIFRTSDGIYSRASRCRSGRSDTATSKSTLED